PDPCLDALCSGQIFVCWWWDTASPALLPTRLHLHLIICDSWVAGLSWPPNAFYTVFGGLNRSSVASVAGRLDDALQASSAFPAVLRLYPLFGYCNCDSPLCRKSRKFVLRALLDYRYHLYQSRSIEYS